MADFNSDQAALRASEPAEPISPHDRSVSIQRVAFDVTIPAGTGAGDVVTLCTVPPNSRIVGGILTDDGSGAGGSTIEIGNSTDSDKYREATVLNGTPQSLNLADTLARNYGAENTAEEVVLGTIAVAGLTAAKIWKGEILFVQTN